MYSLYSVSTIYVMAKSIKATALAFGLNLSIPFLRKNCHCHVKNEYTNANSLREHTPVIPHNDDISYIK